MSVTDHFYKYLTEQAAKNRTPLTVNLELLPYCNLSCKMCYIESSRQDVERLGGLLPKDRWLAIGEQIRDAGALFVLLTGGEAMLRPDFKEIYQGLYEMGLVLTVNTNATMINEDMADFFLQYPPKCISISLYGFSEKVYQNLCGSGRMFHNVLNAIKLLQERNINIECKTILTPLNIEDMEACIAFTKEHNIHYELTPYVFPATRKVDRSRPQIRFSADEACEVIFTRNKLMNTQEEYLAGNREHWEKYLRTKDKPGRIQCGLNCSGTNTACWITWQGKMRPCALLNYPETYPFEDGFLPSWELLKEKMDSIQQSSKCSHCDKREVCTVCPAANYAETGAFDQTSTYHCRLTELTLARIQREMDADNREESS